MSMKNIIRMLILPLVISFSLLVLVKVFVVNDTNSRTPEIETQGSGDAGEKPICLDEVRFTSLDVCRRGEEYCTGNDLIAVSDVYFGSTVVSMNISISSVDRVFGPLTLYFKEDECIIKHRIDTCIPGKVYRVTIPLTGDRFCLYDAKWGSIEKNIMVSERHEFKGALNLTGPNTLRYFTLKKRKVNVLDSNFCVINVVTLHGFGIKRLNFGAAYYEEVRE